MAKVRKAELSILYTTHCLILIYTSTKYHRNIPKGIQVTERTQNLFQIKQRVITPNVRKPELLILYAKCQLLLIYISTKYHQNIPKGIQVTEWTKSFTVDTTNGIHPQNNMYLPSLVGRGWGRGGDIIKQIHLLSENGHVHLWLL